MLKTSSMIFAAIAVFVAVSASDRAVLDNATAVDSARRAAYRAINPTDENLLRQLTQDRDPEIRLQAIRTIFQQEKTAALPVLAAAVKDPEFFIRRYALKALGSMAASESQANDLLIAAEREDSSALLRNLAGQLQPWPFKRKNLRLSEDPSWDYDVKVIERLTVPEDRIKFMTDPKNTGHRQNWFAPDFKDAAWAAGTLGFWERCGYADYDGVAWYRLRFVMPSKPDCHAVELFFAGVSHSSWVWLNGVYLGDHNVKGTPFALDCRKEINWGGENLLVVRVLDSQNDQGGIYKSIILEILKSDGL